MQYSGALLIERIRRHMADGFPSDEFSMSDNEIMLYIDAAVASTLIGSVLGMYKVTGVMEVPDAYIVNTKLDPLVKNANTTEWVTTLPQTPVSLPLGLALNKVYFYNEANGESIPAIPVKSRRVAFRDYLPRPDGVNFRVINGTKLLVNASNGTSLADFSLYVDMVSTRISDKNATLTLPDDAIDAVFDRVIAKCKERMGLPKDIIKDDLPAGNKTS